MAACLLAVKWRFEMVGQRRACGFGQTGDDTGVKFSIVARSLALSKAAMA